MKPLRIEIINFGAIAHTVIDLSNITCAAICGPNGAGKSTAFTIAPMFALFGTTKAGTSADDMVRSGATEAAVTFDFEHHGDIWRVIRTRSTKGRGKSTLELQRKSGELWASESGASIAETQKKIIDLLNLDAETFSSSSMILQGHANEFTARPAGQRKAIFSQILQLAQYEKLQEKATAKAQEVNSSIEKCKAKLEDIDARLITKPGLESDKLDIEVGLAGVAKAIKQGENDLQAAQVEYSALVARLQQADEIDKQAKEKWADIGGKSAERDRQQTRLANAQKLLARETDILSKVAAYETAKDSVTVLRAKKGQQNALFEEASRLKTELDGVASNLKTVIAEIERVEKNIADRPRLEKSKQEFDIAVDRLAACQKEHEEDKRLLAVWEEANTKLMHAEDRYESQQSTFMLQLSALEAKTAMLADANCVDIEHASCKFLADAIQAKSDIVTVQTQYDAWKNDADNEIAGLQKAVKAMESKRTEYRAAVHLNPLEPYELQETIDHLKLDLNLLTKLDAMEPLLINLKTQRTGLETRQSDIAARLESMRAQHKKLSGEIKELPALESQLTALEPWLKSKEQLPAAREAAKTAQEIIDRLNTEIDTLTTQALKLEEEYKTILGNAKELKERAAAKVIALQENLKGTRDDHTRMTAQLGGIQAKLDGLAQDELTRKALVSELEPKTKELVRWQTLVKAFGRDGIPALIIENAVPELERIANDILGQMTGGKNYLKFETQKELKSRSGMAETLDIIDGDWAGERI